YHTDGGRRLHDRSRSFGQLRRHEARKKDPQQDILGYPACGAQSFEVACKRRSIQKTLVPQTRQTQGQCLRLSPFRTTVICSSMRWHVCSTRNPLKLPHCGLHPALATFTKRRRTCLGASCFRPSTIGLVRETCGFTTFRYCSMPDPCILAPVPCLFAPGFT